MEDTVMDDTGPLSVLREVLRENLGPQRYDLWVGPHTTLEWTGSALRVGCGTPFELQWLRRRLHETLLTCCGRVWGGGRFGSLAGGDGASGEQVEIQYFVNAAPAAPTPQKEPALPREQEPQSVGLLVSSPENSCLEKDLTAGPSETKTAQSRTSKPRTEKPGNSQSKLSFRNFVVGKSNELAFRTAKAVAGQLGQYGPLLLFGPAGVGKTHLQFAMLQHLRRGPTRIRSLRLTSEQFTAEFLDALNRRTLPSFRHKYRTIDVLLIDDIQFMEGKRATLDELLFTIDTLHERGRQVILTSDRSPGDLHKISAELVSRISGGLAIPIEQPDYATRLDLVRQLALRRHISLDEETVALVATQVVGSARQLSGAINRLSATSLALGEEIAPGMARIALAEFVQQNAPAVRLADIQRAVCEVFGVEASSLKSNRKTRSVSEPRMLAMWLARKYTRAALGEIGEFFGRRSHSTVISAQRKIEGLVSKGAAISVADRDCHVEEVIRKVESALRTA